MSTPCVDLGSAELSGVVKVLKTALEVMIVWSNPGSGNASLTELAGGER